MESSLIPDSLNSSKTTSFIYQRPTLTGSAWDSISQSFPRTEIQINLMQTANGLAKKRKLTKLIESITISIDKSLLVIEKIDLPSQSHNASSSTFELGLTIDELVEYKHIETFKTMVTAFQTRLIMDNHQALAIFKLVNLSSDLAQVALKMAKLSVSDQNQLVERLGEKLAFLLFIYKQSVTFWSSLDTPNRRQNIRRLYDFNPTSRSIDRMIRVGTRSLAVIKQIKIMKFLHSKHIFERDILRLEKKLLELDEFQKQIKEYDNLIQGKQSISLPHNTAAPSFAEKWSFLTPFDMKAGMSFYDKALEKLGLEIGPPHSKYRHQILNETLETIKFNIESNLVIKDDFVLDESLRGELLQILDPILVSFLDDSELTVYLGIFQARMKLLDGFENVDGALFVLDLIENWSLGDELAIKVFEVYNWSRNRHRVSLFKVGQVMAQNIKIALAEHFFWEIAVKDEVRLLEMDRFLSFEANEMNVKEEIEVGRKLSHFCRKVQSNQNLKLIEEKMAALVEFEIDYIVPLL